MDTHFKPVNECATSTLREELRIRNLSDSGTRTQLLNVLRAHDITIIKEGKQEPERERTRVPENVLEQQTSNTRDFNSTTYSPISPYVPCVSASRSTELISDAAYTVLRTHDIKSVRSLYVAEVDVVAEIEDIKVLKNKLVEEYLTLRNDVEHLKLSLHNTLNQDLYMYNIANEISWNDFDHYIHFPFPITILNPRFFGKIEDSVVHGNLHFEVEFESSSNVSDNFYIDLPVMFDSVLEMCPIMVLVHSNYNNSTMTYDNESTTCHAYIHSKEPTKLRVFCPSLYDYNRLQFDVTLRYFGKPTSATLSPSRLSAIYYTKTTSERGHVVKHHWSELEDRVELFTNIDIVASMDGVDIVHVKLPVMCSDDKYIDVVGYGIVHYTLTSDDENTLIYSNNTALVRISQTDTSLLQIKSALMQNINEYSDMSVATHIIYTKKAVRDIVYEFIVNSVFMLPGHEVSVSFLTSEPVNAFYFQSIKAINNDTEFQIPISALNGFQNTWNFKWTIPLDIEDHATIRFTVNLFNNIYKSNNEVFVITKPLYAHQVYVSVVNVGAHDITFWLESIDTKFAVPYDVKIYAMRTDGTIDASALVWKFSRDSQPVWIQLTNLKHKMAYTVQLVFTDPFERITIVELIHYTLDIDSNEPILYDIKVHPNVDGTASVSGEVYNSLNNFTWYVFSSSSILSDTLVLLLLFMLVGLLMSDTKVSILYGNTNNIEGDLDITFSNNTIVGSQVKVLYFVAVNNIDLGYSIRMEIYNNE